MGYWPWLRGLVLSPLETWQGLAVSGPPSLKLLLPLILLPWLLMLALAAILGGPLLPWVEQGPVMMRRPDGTMVQIGTRISGHAGALLINGMGMASTLAWVVVQRGMILRSAARHLAMPDTAAALKLTLYAPVAVWIALYLLPVVPFLLLPAMIHAVVLVYLGAPILMPPHAGQEKRFARSVAFGTVLFGLATIGLASVGILWITQAILG